MTQVLAATGLVNGALDYHPLDPNGSSTVVATTSFKIQVNRLLLPSSANRQAVCLQRTLDHVAQPSGCANGITLHPSYDPVRREVTYYMQAADAGPLLPGTRYLLTVFVAADPTQTGLVSYDGVSLQQPYPIEFTALASTGTMPPFDAPPTADHFCGKPDPSCSDLSPTCVRSVSTILQGCSFGGCHSVSPSSDAGALALASDDLEMDTTDRLLATAIGHPAHETQTGENGRAVDQNPLRFGRTMAVIDPGVPSESYLVYKLLANRNNPLVVPWSPAGDAMTDPPEVARLRNELVVGMPMPPSTEQSASSSAALHPGPGCDPAADSTRCIGEMEWLSAWILQGAPTPACP